MADSQVPALTAAQMLEVDRMVVDEYGIKLVQMMELAGARLARLAMNRFPGSDAVGILAGSGGNGGGALACARHLHNHGIDVRVFLSKPPAKYSGVPAHQLAIIEHLEVPIEVGPPAADAPDSDGLGLLVDGVIGYSLSGTPRGTAAALIAWSRRADVPVLALDVPSGVDATTGTVGEPAVQATATMTLALPKTGLAAGDAAAYAGELYLADIGVPPEVYRLLGLEMPGRQPFAAAPIVALHAAAATESARRSDPATRYIVTPIDSTENHYG